MLYIKKSFKRVQLLQRTLSTVNIDQKINSLTKQKILFKNLYRFKFLNQEINQDKFIFIFQYGSLSLVEKRLLKKKVEALQMKISFFYSVQKDMDSRLLYYYFFPAERKINASSFAAFEKRIFNFNFFLKSFRGSFFFIYGNTSNLLNVNSIVKDFKPLLIKGVVNNVLYDQINSLLFIKNINQEKYKYLIEIYTLFFNFRLILSLLSYAK